ncbi:nucleoside triphosphate pyrophosphohydrolase [Candidatus Woesearchaeota archaeon]|nr:nucleoside triphosphate pyrophosphohydrolase [Candidatus Woesearchaeota archaeon]
MEYNKLVRDKIPIILRRKGLKYKFHVANNQEYWQKLKEKLGEEVEEFMKCATDEELADILEVIYAIIDFKKINKNDLEIRRNKKAKERGKFKKKLILEEVS